MTNLFPSHSHILKIYVRPSHLKHGNDLFFKQYSYLTKISIYYVLIVIRQQECLYDNYDV